MDWYIKEDAHMVGNCTSINSCHDFLTYDGINSYSWETFLCCLSNVWLLWLLSKSYEEGGATWNPQGFWFWLCNCLEIQVLSNYVVIGTCIIVFTSRWSLWVSWVANIVFNIQFSLLNFFIMNYKVKKLTTYCDVFFLLQCKFHIMFEWNHEKIHNV